MKPEGIVSVQEVLAYLEQEQYVGVPAAARYLGISERSIWAHIKEIPRFRFGSRTLFKKSELDRWFEQFRTRTNTDRCEKMEPPRLISRSGWLEAHSDRRSQDPKHVPVRGGDG